MKGLNIAVHFFIGTPLSYDNFGCILLYWGISFAAKAVGIHFGSIFESDEKEVDQFCAVSSKVPGTNLVGLNAIGDTLTLTVSSLTTNKRILSVQ